MGLGRRGSPKGSPNPSPTSGSPASEAPPSITKEPLARSGVALSRLSRTGACSRGRSAKVLYKSGSTGHTTGDGVTSPCLD